MDPDSSPRLGAAPAHVLVAQMADGVVVIDPAGVVCFANGAAHRLFGHAHDEGMVGSLFGVPVVASGVAEIELVSGTSVRLAELNVTQISWGNTPAWLVVLRDVTARRERERGVFRKAQEFEEFAYTVSHDLQEPLRTIEQLALAYVEDFAKAEPDEADRLVNMMRDIATRGRAMVSSLIEYAALGADADTHVPCDLGRVLKDVYANLGAEMEASGAVVVVETPLPTVVANPTHMLQLMQNLVANSLKFRSSAAPEVTINATERQVDWRIDVCDNGVGVPEEQRDYVFGVFAQLARSEAALGSKGLGLSVCKKIVDCHGGSIWIDPAYRDGCKVSFTIPRLGCE
ncbi:MAG: ATP-binding protein [Pseudomonadota bacterium]